MHTIICFADTFQQHITSEYNSNDVILEWQQGDVDVYRLERDTSVGSILTTKVNYRVSAYCE